MLPLRKKKPEPAATPAMPAWHPNFRNFDQLPDTKVVRTAFFVNGVAIVVAAIMLLWFVYNEYRLRDLHRQIDGWQRQIDRDRPASNRLIAMFKTFQAEEARANEIDAFRKSKPLVSELLLHLAGTLPAYVALDGFEFRDNGVTLRGTVRGAPDQASGYASTYLQLLKTDAVLKEKFDEVTLVSLTRSPQTGRLTFEISLKLKSPGASRKP